MQSWGKPGCYKCFVMRVIQSKKYKVLYDYQLHSSTLTSVDHCKYLEVVLQSNLRWSKHIKAITANKKAPISVKEQIYKTVIRPQREYASCVWAPWLKQDILELEKVQYHATRFVYNNYWPTAIVIEMISTFNWETLEKRREKACLCMLYKAINGLIKSQWTTINLLHSHPPGRFMVKICYYPAVEPTYVTGPAKTGHAKTRHVKTGHICTEYICSENYTYIGHFL